MKLPEVKGFIDLSLVDWDGKVTAVIFLPHCNLRCPFCYNATLVLDPEEMRTIPFAEIRLYLMHNRNWLDGVVITGGEPTIHNGLPLLCNQIKELGLKVKLDTNGTNYDMLQKLIAKKHVDYVALDIKAPLIPERYFNAAGVNARKLIIEVEKAIGILLKGSTKRTQLILSAATFLTMRIPRFWPWLPMKPMDILPVLRTSVLKKAHNLLDLLFQLYLKIKRSPS